MSAVEAFGSIPITDVQARLLKACKTLRALPDREAGWRIVRSLWPDSMDDVDMAYGYTAERMPKFNPTPADVSDYLTALGWTRGVEKREFRYVWWRSFGLSFGWMGRRVHKSDERCRQIYRDVLVRAWHAANSA